MIFWKSRPRKKAWGRRTTARVAASATAVPAVGGTSTIAEVRAGRRGPRGEFIPLDASGESLFQLFSVPSHACHAIIPSEATIVARRVPIPLFGAGLVEAIPDDTLLALEDPYDLDRDGVSGRAARIVRSRVRRAACWPVRLEGTACDAPRLWRRCVSQRDGDHQRSLPAGTSPRSLAGTYESLRSAPRSRRREGSANRPPGHRQLRQLHEIPCAARPRST